MRTLLEHWRAPLALLLAATLGYLGLGRESSSAPTQVGLANDDVLTVQPLPPDTAWDYQIGGARPFDEEVGIVVRDRLDLMAGVYDVCYVNAFQTQEAEKKFWRHESRRDLILRNAGEPVMDGAWGERLLDTRTRSKRLRLTAVVDEWIEGCRDSGAEAVELDNLDSWTRSQKLLSRRDNLRYARRLVAAAHARGLAVAQKNTPQIDNGRELGFDFAMAEECAKWRECHRYTDEYGSLVLAVEYGRRSFERGCAAWGESLPIILRDVEVSPEGPTDRC